VVQRDDGILAMTEEQPIDIHHYTWAIRRALPRILAVAFIAGLAAAAGAHVLTPRTYSASTTILAGTTIVGNQSLDSTTLTRRLATVNLLTDTTGVLSVAASKLPRTTVDELRAAVHSSVDPNANVITITATAGTAREAADRANQVAPALIASAREIEQQAATKALQAAVAQVRQLRSAGASQAAIQAAEGQLSSASANAGDPSGGLEIVQAAEPPTAPSSPAPWFAAVVGFLGVVALGMLVVLAREQIAPHVSSSSDLDQVFGVPVLASVPLIRRVKPSELARLARPVRDSFYVLASGVRQSSKKQKVKIIFVVSAIGGEGRTTVAANLSRVLASSGATVLCIGADVRSPRIHKWLETPQSPGLTDVLAEAGEDSARLEAAELPAGPRSFAVESALRSAIWIKYGNLHFLASGVVPDDPTPLFFGHGIASIFKAIRGMGYDFVIVDTPAAFDSPDTRALAPYADAFLAVVRTRELRMKQAIELRDLLDAFDKPMLGLAVFERDAHLIGGGAPDRASEARERFPREGGAAQGASSLAYDVRKM
jgi:Mrp family chromosome partitioning ATPase